jgi:hypothetical protein
MAIPQLLQRPYWKVTIGCLLLANSSSIMVNRHDPENSSSKVRFGMMLSCITPEGKGGFTGASPSLCITRESFYLCVSRSLRKQLNTHRDCLLWNIPFERRSLLKNLGSRKIAISRALRRLCKFSSLRPECC